MREGGGEGWKGENEGKRRKFLKGRIEGGKQGKGGKGDRREEEGEH